MTWTWTLEFYLSLCIFTVSGNLLLPTCRQHVNANGTYPQLHVNATNPQLPRCATSIKNFRKGIHLRERSWSYENDDATSLLPPWTDISLAVKGQQFAIDRVQGIFQSYLYGVTLILANPQLRDTLLFTGWTPTSRKCCALIIKDGTHPMNQLTFATTQWAFMGLTIMNPSNVNVYDVADDGLQAFAHLWAVLGYAMGLEDEFNLGFRNGREKLVKLNQQFFRNYVAPHLFRLTDESKLLIEAFIKGAAHILEGLDPEYLLRGILRDVFGIWPKNMNARMKISEMWSDFLLGNGFPRWIHAVFPGHDKIVSPLFSLYHFKVGFTHFGARYRSDEDIAKYCYFYEEKL
ncbi:hypothetical protein Fcan01_18324 [Folsomia candida]|uniref:ER-bound oxygenase mpaB/mpaB'/Rubber oxygenase catalytic domain-containing protein n=1 Tax=Folsomia candida TaxID=158441 RepID=A0A226DPF0_FOLCA|nr:hypothetical protein Fcan01_18324 [Folsomia candida]